MLTESLVLVTKHADGRSQCAVHHQQAGIQTQHRRRWDLRGNARQHLALCAQSQQLACPGIGDKQAAVNRVHGQGRDRGVGQHRRDRLTVPLRERAAQQLRGAGFTRELAGCQQAAGGIEGERRLQAGKTQVAQHNVGATDARPVVQQQVIAGQQQWSLLGRDGDGGRAGDRCRRRQAQQADAHGEAGNQGDRRSGKGQAHDAVRLPRPGADLRCIAKGPQVIEIGRPGLALAFAPRGGFCRLTLARGRLQPGPDAGIHGFEPGFVGEFDGCALNGLLFHLAVLGGLFFQFGL